MFAQLRKSATSSYAHTQRLRATLLVLFREQGLPLLPNNIFMNYGDVPEDRL